MANQQTNLARLQALARIHRAAGEPGLKARPLSARQQAKFDRFTANHPDLEAVPWGTIFAFIASFFPALQALLPVIEALIALITKQPVPTPTPTPTPAP